MKSQPHFVLIGDINGPEGYHVGDEAMFAANVEGLRLHFGPGCRITGISSDPEWSAHHHGIKAVPRFGFAEAEAMDALLAKLVQAAARGTWDAQDGGPACSQVLDALASADAAIICGGGNLNSTWPGHLYERIAFIEAAARLGVPSVVTGQTLGPHLRGEHRELLAGALQKVALVGARELPSISLALDLGVAAQRLIYQLDDAFGLSPEDIPEGTGTFPSSNDWIAVTLSSSPRSPEVMAARLAEVQDAIGLPLWFIPHAVEDRDLALSHEVSDLLPGESHVMDVLPCRQVIEVTRRASMVISTRYHPLVFGLAHGIPCLGVYGDEYTRVKLQGALRHYGLEAWTLAADFAWNGDLSEASLELWNRRGEVAEHLHHVADRLKNRHRHHWERFESSLASPSQDEERPSARRLILPAGPMEGPDPESRWSRHQAILLSTIGAFGHRQRQLSARLDDSIDYALSLADALAKKEEEVQALSKALQEQADQRNHELAEVERYTASLLRSLREKDQEIRSRNHAQNQRSKEQPEAPGEQLSLSVVIPTRDTKKLTLACLDSIAMQEVEDIQVVVVADGSANETVEAVRRRHPQVTILQTPEPQGFTLAASRGLDSASGDILLLLNSDTELAPGALENLLQAFATHPDLGIAGSQLRNFDGSDQWSGSSKPTLLWLLLMASGVPAWLNRMPFYRRLRPLSGRDSGEVAWVTGAAMAIRRRVWASHGPFDPRFLMYAQDLDLCLRATAGGWSVEVLPNVAVFHHQGATIRNEQVATERGQRLDWLWPDLVAWGRKWKGEAWARRALRCLFLGSRLRLFSGLCQALIGGSSAKRRFATQRTTIRQALDSARQVLAEEAPREL